MGVALEALKFAREMAERASKAQARSTASANTTNQCTPQPMAAASYLAVRWSGVPGLPTPPDAEMSAMARRDVIKRNPRSWLLISTRLADEMALRQGRALSDLLPGCRPDRRPEPGSDDTGDFVAMLSSGIADCVRLRSTNAPPLGDHGAVD